MELFLKQMCNENNLDEKIVLCKWSEFSNTLKKYNDMKKPELVSLCKVEGFKSSGNKQTLIDNIINKIKEDVKITTKPKKKMSPGTKQTIIDKLKKEAPAVVIRRNEHGNYEHSETGFLFDPVQKLVIGKQSPDGTVIDISKDDIELCKKYNFNYNIPFVLDNKGETTETKVVDELLDEEAMQCDDSDSDSDIEY